MPLLQTSQAWIDQSALLVKACPTVRVTSKYSLLAPKKSQIAKFQKRSEKVQQKRSENPESVSESYLISEPKHTSFFELKTYDPVTGACLKYRTDKAAEVGRLMDALERLSRVLGGLPDDPPKVADIPPAIEVAATTASVTANPPSQEAKPADKPAATGGQGKKKKKGKK